MSKPPIVQGDEDQAGPTSSRWSPLLELPPNAKTTSPCSLMKRCRKCSRRSKNHISSS